MVPFIQNSRTEKLICPKKKKKIKRVVLGAEVDLQKRTRELSG